MLTAILTIMSESNQKGFLSGVSTLPPLPTSKEPEPRSGARLSDEEAFDTFRLVRWSTKARRSAPLRVRRHLQLQGPQAVEVQELQPPVLRHLGDHLRQPQAADPRHPARHRDLRERRQGP